MFRQKTAQQAGGVHEIVVRVVKPQPYVDDVA
jgi:hypothetical protein